MKLWFRSGFRIWSNILDTRFLWKELKVESGWKQLTIFTKSFILDAWLNFEYAPVIRFQNFSKTIFMDS